MVCSLPLEVLLKVIEYFGSSKNGSKPERAHHCHQTVAISFLVRFDVLRQTLTFLNPGDTDVTADTKTYFRWRHGLQYGRPVKIILPWPEGPRCPTKVRYHSWRLVDSRPGISEVEESRFLDLKIRKRPNLAHQQAAEAGDWTEEAPRGIMQFLGSDHYLHCCDLH